MRRPRILRATAAGLVILLLAVAGPHLAGAITGTGSHNTGTGGELPTAPCGSPGDPLTPMSAGPDGTTPGGDSSAPAVGGDAPDVVGFRSDADDLTPDDDNGHTDAFVNDGCVIDRVSKDPPGFTVTDVTAGPSVSSTGEEVGYGGKLEEPGTETPVDRVVVIDRPTGTTEVVPPPREGGDIGDVHVSPDGKTVTWDEDGNIYTHPVGSGATEPVLVTRDPDGRPAGESSNPAPCAEGQRVVFASDSPSLVPGDTNGTPDIFVSAGLLTDDPADDQLTLISRAYDGGQADGASSEPSITPDCTKVVFTSFATNLVPDDRNGTSDVFVHDLTTGVTTLVSKDGNGPSGQGSISDDGGYVAFASAADNLVADDHNGVDPRNATPTSFQALDRAGGLTYATSVISVDGPRVRVGFPATLDFSRLSAGSVDNGALIDDQVLPVDNRDGRSNTNSLATRGPTTLDAAGSPVAPGPDVTDGPDLSSAEVVVDDNGNSDPGDDVAVVRYCFDEPVADVLVRGDPAGTDDVATDRFLVEGYNSAVRLRSIRATVEREIQINQVGGEPRPACVRARFADGVEVDRFVGAAVLPNAVADRDKQANVKGSTPLSGSIYDPQDGDITGPNLRSAQSDVAGNRVTYLFDDIEVTPSLLSDLATRFAFVDPDGILRPGRFVTAADGTAESVTVEFDVNTANVTNARRFVVLPAAVRNAGGEPNVEQSTDGDAAGPELLAVNRVGPIGAPGPPSFDFVFSTNVRQEDLAKFLLYTEDGTAFPSASFSRPSPRVVRITAPAVERFPESIVLGVAQSAAVHERLVEPTTPIPEPPRQRLTPRQTNGEFSGAPNALGAKGITRRFSPAGSVTDGPDLIGVEPHPELGAIDFVFDEAVRDTQLGLNRTPPDLPTDVFVVELITGDIVRVSVDANGRELPGSSFAPHISRDGRYVVFSYRFVLRSGVVRIIILRRDLLIAQITPQAIDFGPVAAGGGASDPQRVEVSNRGFGRLVVRDVELVGLNPDDFDRSADGCTGKTLLRRQVCVLSLTFAPGAEGSRTGDVVVTDNALGSPRTVALEGRGLPGPGLLGAGPVLTVSPGLGPPGTVAMVQGQGFGAASKVQLRWVPAPGATGTVPPLSPPVSVTADQSGTFGPVALLVLPGDRLTGPRLAEGQGDQPPLVATAPFLVVPGTVQPEATPIRVRTGFGEALRTFVLRRLNLVERR